MNADTPLVIAGMHRSGTSLFADYCGREGVHMGVKLVGGSKGNEAGHFEDKDFLRFQSGIMHRQKLDMWRDKALPVFTDQDVEQGATIVKRKQNRDMWGWKDPRTCLFLDLWDEIIPDALYVFVVRAPFLVANSLLRRDGAGGDYWRSTTLRLRAWRTSTGACRQFFDSHRQQCRVILLEHALSMPKALASTLSELSGIDFSPTQWSISIKPGLLHQRLLLRQRIAMPVEYIESMLTYHRMISRAAF